MTARLRKETRELLPVFAGTALLMAAPAIVGQLVTWQRVTGADGDVARLLTTWAFGLGCAVMAGLSFGGEFQHRTLGLFLSQPLRRSVLWREKMVALGGGLVFNCWALLICLLVEGARLAQVPPETVLTLAAVVLCAFCGIPCLTLAARSGLGGAVFGVVIPIFFSGIVALLAERLLPRLLPGLAEKHGPLVVGAVLLVYCPLFYWLGYKRFLMLEAKDGTAAEVGLPARLEALLARGLGRAVSGVSGPFWALVKKELRLQMISFELAAACGLLAVVGGIGCWAGSEWGIGVLMADGTIYCIVLPLMVGALAVAEERTWGVSEWQLTLPAAAARQWLAKLLVALPTSVVLGFALPVLITVLGDYVLHAPGVSPELPSQEEAALLLLAHLVAVSLAIYVATFAGGTLRAIVTALVIAAFGIGCAVLAGRWVENAAHPMFSGRSLLYCFPAMLIAFWENNLPGEPAAWTWLGAGLVGAAGVFLVLTLWALGLANFRHSGWRPRRFVGQLVGLSVLVTLLTAICASFGFFITLHPH